jgi:hypothetical protein
MTLTLYNFCGYQFFQLIGKALKANISKHNDHKVYNYRYKCDQTFLTWRGGALPLPRSLILQGTQLFITIAIYN